MASPVGEFTNLTPQRGLGKATNVYGWAAEAPSFGDQDLFVGTFSINFDWFAVENYLGQVSNGGPLAPIDAFRRIWSESPITPTLGGEIHRFDGTSWTQEYGPGVGDPDLGIAGFRSMVEHDGKLYAGTANGPTGPAPWDFEYSYAQPGATVTYQPGDGSEIYVRDNTTGTWSVLTPDQGPGGNDRNSSIRTMMSAGGKLWVGTENPTNPNDPDVLTGVTGPELWSYTEGGGWTLEAEIPVGLAIGELDYVNGKVLVGTWGTGAGGALEVLSYDPSSPGVLTDVTPNVPGLSDSNGVMEMRHFDGKYFVGGLDYGGGFKLVYTEDDPHDATANWMTVTTSGFADEYPGDAGPQSNAYPWSSVEIDGVYYLGTFSTNTSGSPLDLILGENVPLDGRGQIWYSLNGTDWKILEDNGFDSPFTYGMREMVDWRGNLTVATASNLFIPSLLDSPYPEYAELGFEEFLSIMGQELPQVTTLLSETGMSQEEMARVLGYFDHDGQNDFLPLKGFEVYSAPSLIPLPAGAVLLLSGLLALPLMRRRKAA